jgi:hypothetical protein
VTELPVAEPTAPASTGVGVAAAPPPTVEPAPAPPAAAEPRPAPPKPDAVKPEPKAEPAKVDPPKAPAAHPVEPKKSDRRACPRCAGRAGRRASGGVRRQGRPLRRAGRCLHRRQHAARGAGQGREAGPEDLHAVGRHRSRQAHACARRPLRHAGRGRGRQQQGSRAPACRATCWCCDARTAVDRLDAAGAAGRVGHRRPGARIRVRGDVAAGLAGGLVRLAVPGARGPRTCPSARPARPATWPPPTCCVSSASCCLGAAGQAGPPAGARHAAEHSRPPAGRRLRPAARRRAAAGAGHRRGTDAGGAIETLAAVRRRTLDRCGDERIFPCAASSA